VLAIFIYESVALSQNQNLIANNEVRYDSIPQSIDMHATNLMFSIGNVEATGAVPFNQSMFNFILYSYTKSKDSDGSSITTSTPINLRPCQQSDYMNLTEFYTYAVNGSLCPVSNDYAIFGGSTTVTSQYFKFEVVPCTNQSNSSVTCASPDQIAEYLNAPTKKQITVFFLNTNVQSSNFSYPVSYFIDTITFNLSPGLIVTETDLLFRKTTVNTISNILGTGSGDNIITTSFNQDRTDSVYGPQYLPGVYLAVNLKASNYENLYYRSYMTLSNVVAIIGGIWNVAYLGLGFLASYINNMMFKLQLARQLNKHDNNENATSRKDNDDYAPLTPPENHVNNYVNSDKERDPDKSDNSSAISNFTQVEFLKGLICCNANMKANRKKIDNIIEDMAKEMDISYILDKLQKVSKLTKPIHEKPPQMVQRPCLSSPTNQELKESTYDVTRPPREKYQIADIDPTPNQILKCPEQNEVADVEFVLSNDELYPNISEGKKPIAVVRMALGNTDEHDGLKSCNNNRENLPKYQPHSEKSFEMKIMK